MPNFVDRGMGNRFTKRVNFDRSDNEDMLGQIIDQIHEKRDRDLLEKIREREDEQGLLDLQRKLMSDELYYETEDKTNKANAFITANQILKDEKVERSQNEQELKQIERLNYFPFTHGDMIEKQRNALNQLQKHEQLDAIKERAQDEISRKRNQARLNAEANQQMLLSFQRQVMDEQIGLQRQRDPMSKKLAGESVSQTSAAETTVSPAQTNLFTKNGSKTLPPRRQQLAVTNSEIQEGEAGLGGNQYQLAMSEALARHEAEVLRVGELRKLQEGDWNKQIIVQKEIVAAEKEATKFHKMQLHQELGSQIQEYEARRIADTKERKQLLMTTGGPTQEPEDVVALQKKAKERKLIVKLNLEAQRDMDKL